MIKKSGWQHKFVVDNLTIQRPKLTRIKAKGWLKWFKRDQYILEYEFVKVTGEWNDDIVPNILMAGDRPIYREV